MKQNYDKHVEQMENGRILLKKKTKFLKHGWLLCSNGVACDVTFHPSTPSCMR
jgi:hypothetical protein